jgi:hypothetical protein
MMLVPALHYEHQQEDAMAIDAALKNMQASATRGIDVVSQEPPSAAVMQVVQSGAVAPEATMIQAGPKPGGSGQREGSASAE